MSAEATGATPAGVTAPRVSVVIPNWNGAQHLPECFAALEAQTYTDFDIIVVDNASSDQSVAWVREHAPSAQLVQRPDNGGFSKAVNAGIRASSAPYIVLLNNDTRADEGWLAELVAALDSNPHYHFAASLMLLYYEDGLVNAAGDYYDVGRMIGRNRGLGAPVDGFTETVRVLGACAGAAIYRAGVFDDVGLFDEDYFLTSEDTDWNLRALIAGKKCLYVPSARIRHKLRSSIETHPAERMTLLAERNEAMTFAKSMPVPILLVAPALWLYKQLRATVIVGPSHWRSTPARLRELPKRIAAQREGWRLGWAKRGNVWSRRRSSLPTMVRWLVRGTGKA